MKTFLFQRFFIDDKLYLAYFCQSLPFQYELIEKNSFDLSRYPAVSNLFYSNKVGLLTCPCLLRLPSILPVADECNKPQKKGLTATGIVSDSHRIPFSLFWKKTPQELLIALAKVCYIFYLTKKILFFLLF